MAYLPINDTSLISLNVTAQDIASTTVTVANSQPITTGNPTANSAASFSVISRETILVMVSGTWTGTLMSEGSFDGGTTWVSKAVKQIGTGYTTNSLTGNFAGAVNVAGLTNYRIRSTTAWTGTAVVGVVSSSNPHSLYIVNNLALRDGTTQSVTNTIKPASTAPVTTDTAVVVGVSPNGNTVKEATLDASISTNGATLPGNYVAIGLSDGSNLRALRSNLGDGAASNTVLGANQMAFNGSTFDRTRSATAASNTTGTGLLGAGILGFDGTDYQRISTNTAGVQNINLNPSAAGGYTPYLANVITTTVTVSSAAGKFGGYSLINLNSVPAFLQCFDTTGAVTLGTTAPTFVIPLPANATAANGVGANIEFPNGINLVNGLKIAATTTVNGATTVSTGLQGSILFH